MKKSVWYHELWRKKMAELPVDDDLDAAWQQMNDLLDQPFVPSSAKEISVPKNGLITSLTQVIKIILPIVLVTGGVYFAFYQKTVVDKKQKTIKQEQVKRPQERRGTEKLSVADTSTLMPFERIPKEMFAKEGKLSLKNDLRETSSISPIHREKIENSNSGNAAIFLDKAQIQINIDGTTAAKASLLPYLKNTVELGTYQGVAASLKWQRNELAQNSQKYFRPSVILSKREQRRLRRVFVRDSVKKAKAESLLQIANLKTNKAKSKKEKSKEMVSPKFSFELQGGAMFANQNVTPYLGIQGQWALAQRWLLGAGVRFTQVKLDGTYEHPGYNTVTTGSPFQVVDSRKLSNLVLPLNLSYRVNKLISLKAEANLVFPLAQSGGSKVGYVANYLDTVFHTQQIQQALSETSVNKLHLNIGGGVNIQIKRFKLEAMYFYQPSPYRVSSSLGNYQRRYRSFSVGLGYRF